MANDDKLASDDRVDDDRSSSTPVEAKYVTSFSRLSASVPRDKKESKSPN